jgi:uncharacterized protein (TIGR00296 family)
MIQPPLILSSHKPINYIMLTEVEGKAAVKLARKALTEYVEKRTLIKPEELSPIFDEKQGVFVTLHEDGDLRGCIGYPMPIMPLGKAIVDSAINAGTGDPRFPPIKSKELVRIEFEVTILTKPEPYDAPKSKLPELVKIGIDGLIVYKGVFSGLLLPQVAPEWGFDPITFLSQVCLKAGLPADAWIDEDTEIHHFQAQIFAELAPQREIIEKSYADSSCGTK